MAALLFTGCRQDELATDQYSDTAVTLASFGPNPVMRGGALTFYGSNLDKIVEVNVPGAGALTNIEVVKSGNPSEIRVVLPADGTTVGKVTLKASDGTVLETQGELTYIEPIVIDSFSPTSAMPGDVITIKGDYMNLVAAVEFPGGTVVPVEEGASRYQVSVTVPSTAITGTFILQDGSTPANLIYATETLTIGDPTVSGISAADPKPGKSVVVSGKYLDMIKTVIFAGGVEIDVADFILNGDNTTLTVTIPATAQSGDVVLVDYAGKEYTPGSIEMTAPSGLSVSPSPVKAGNELVISGEDLDVVTTVNFPGANNAGFAYADGSITVTAVPFTATEGDITLVMANGESAAVAYTLVHPTITGVSPTELMAGGDITVTGTDLDLVTAATLGGKEVTLTSVSETEAVLTTSNTSVSGTVTLSLANGEQIADGTAITLSYDSYIIVNELTPFAHIGDIVYMSGENFMMIENIFIGDAKVTQWISRTDNSVSFIMPWNAAPATYEVTFHLYNGEVETCPSTIDVGLEINHIIAWEGSTQITWSDGGRVLIPASKFNGVTAGTKMYLSFTQVDQQWDQAQVNYGDWTGLVFPEVGSNTIVPTDIYGWFPDGILDRVLEVTLTQEILDNIQAKKGDCEGQSNVGIIIQGSGLTFTKVEILQEISQEVTIFEGPVSLTWGDDGRFGLAMTYFEAAHAGSKLIFYVEQSDAWGQIQLNDGWWANGDMYFPEVEGAYITTDNIGGKDVTRVELTITADVLNHILATPGDYFGLNTDYRGDGRVAMVIQGSDMTINKVCIL